MGIRLTPSARYRADIEYTLKTEDGRDEKQKFTAIFERRSAEELKEMTQSGKSDADLVREILKGWDMTDLETRDKVEYSDAIRDAILAQPGVASVVIMRYLETVVGSRAKN